MNRLSLHEATVDSGAIGDNARELVAGSASEIIADVRADGYGHGAVLSAKAIVGAGVRWLGVSCSEDAVQLHTDGVNAEFVVIRGDEIGYISSLYSGAQPPTAFNIANNELYGLTSLPGFRPAMRVSARVVATKTIDGGEGVSYGFTYRAPRRTNLALLAIGYANGLDRSASNLGKIWLGGKCRLIAGRVAMNVVVVELQDDVVRVGDEAVVFGDPNQGEPSILDWASRISKDPREVASTFGSHLPRTAN